MCSAGLVTGAAPDSVFVSAFDPWAPDASRDPHHRQNRLSGGTSEAHEGQYMGTPRNITDGRNDDLSIVQPSASTMSSACSSRHLGRSHKI
jgi:hypothetical protein